MVKNRKPILCLDFDGVLHSYRSGWKGPRTIPDPPVAGAMPFLIKASETFDIQIFSSRGRYFGGRRAMRKWLEFYLGPTFVDQCIKFPLFKPPAFVTLDDRAITFTGTFPEPLALLDFKPWTLVEDFKEEK